MAIWEDIVLNAQTAVSTVGKKANEIVDISKLRISAAELTKEISGKYAEIGRVVYEAKKTGAEYAAEVDAKIAEVEELYAELASLNERIAELKKTVKCPSCGANTEKGNQFCPKCGAKL